MATEKLLNDATEMAHLLVNRVAQELQPQLKAERDSLNEEVNHLHLVIESLQRQMSFVEKTIRGLEVEDLMEVEVKSSLMSKVRYSPSEMSLYITFASNGRTCRYDGVRYRTFSTLIKAKSPGSYFNRNVRDAFSCAHL